MALTKPKYPLDKTGQSATNRVVGEERTVDKQFNRAFSPFGGPFYGDSMVVTDKASGKRLTLGTDYTLIYPYVEATQNLGLPVYNLVNLVNRSYDNVLLTYQVVGGPYSYSVDAIVKMINDLMQDDRVVSWGNLWGKPLAFNPTKHLHAATDLYSLEYVVLALEELTRAVIQGDVASHNVIYDYINRIRTQVYDEIAKLKAADADLYVNVTRLDGRIDAVITQLNGVDAKLGTHIADKNNPHNTTKAQVGLALVENYRIATQTEAETGTSNTVYSTPLTVWQAIAKYTALNITPVINAHIADKANPHGTTKAQVGLGSVENYTVATQLDAESGSSNVLYMTPLRVSQAITKFAITPLNAHINNGNNPHGTTKAQVGLGSVDNFRTASTAEGQAGSSTTLFLTPAGANACAARLDAAWVNQLRAEMNQLRSDLSAQISNAKPNIDVRIANNATSMSGLAAGSRYVLFVDGNLKNGGREGGPQRPSYVRNSSGVALDGTPGRGIDWPDGNAPITATFYFTAPGDGYISWDLDGGTLVNRATLIRLSY